MKDFILGVAIVAVVTVAATETIGLTNHLGGEQPSVPAIVDVVVSEVENAASDIADNVPVPDLPNLPRPSLPGLSPGEATPTATPVPSDTGQLRYISNTDGAGVRVRDDCQDAAPGVGALAEGQSVAVVERGTASCGGWTLVSGGDVRSWVRNEYLDASATPSGRSR